MKVKTSLLATVIGDVVGSRTHPDRRALHRRLATALKLDATAHESPTLTIGDEFQGSYRTVGDAIDAALAIRLHLAPDVDVRFGIGWGAVTRLDPETDIQDGPGWWAAREAIEWTAAAQQQPGSSLIRTTFRNATGTGPDVGAVNAALMCRDQLLGSLDDRSLRILHGLRAGVPKKQLAAAESISASAVSQRAGRDGLDLILLACEQLRGIR